MNRKIPTVVGLLILIGGLIAGVVLVNRGTSLQSKAGPTESPKNIKITNRGSSTASISWTTDVPMTGYIKYSEDPAKINIPAGDVRDQISGTSQSYTNHYVNISGISANKTYYFVIGSGSETYNDNGKPYQFRTLANVSSPAEDVAYGKVINPDNSPVNGAIVFLDIESAETLSAITKNDGGWRINLSTARTADGKIVAVDPKNTTLSIFVQAGSSGTATAITNTEKAKPTTDIVLGKNQSFVEADLALNNLLDPASATRSGTFELTESQLSSPVSGTQSTGAVTFINPAIEGELIATSSPEFKLKLATGSGLILKVGDQISEILEMSEGGEYVWSPELSLERGLNTLLVEYIDSNNEKKELSRTFNVLAVGDISGLPAFVATPSATPTEIVLAPTEATTMPETDSEELEDAGSFELSVIVTISGLILVMLGRALKKKWQ